MASEPVTEKSTDVEDRLIGPLDVGPIAHGGHCVARWEGRVVFVRHSLPGESVMVRVTDTSHAKFWRGDAVEILTAAPDRVTAPCAVAGPGQCGGCDFQHVDLAAQRRLKADVVAEQLLRLAGLVWEGEVEQVSTPDTTEGLGWRTRMRYHVNGEGKVGLRAHRSHEVILLPEHGCPLAAPVTVPVAGGEFPPGAELVAAPGTLLVDNRLEVGASRILEEAAGRYWEVAADGFWQVHPGAPDTLVGVVLDGVRPQAGESAFDLYCGVGLFTGALADHGCEVWAIEQGKAAIQAAHRNLRDVSKQVHLSVGRVERQIARLPRSTDVVVLDPPRTGAGKAVLQAVATRTPRVIAYVACDPAALARDLQTAQTLGYSLQSLRAFDLFPMTHHVECVAILVPSEG